MVAAPARILRQCASARRGRGAAGLLPGDQRDAGPAQQVPPLHPGRDLQIAPAPAVRRDGAAAETGPGTAPPNGAWRASPMSMAPTIRPTRSPGR